MKTHKDGTLPTRGEVFVFGSNLAGVHGAGAAKVALDQFGAEMGFDFGRKGSSYAIPTKGRSMLTLSRKAIHPYARAFIVYAKLHPELQFWLTRIGCGLAGYKDEDIAPLFAGVPDNVSVPDRWEPIIRATRPANATRSDPPKG